MSELRGRIEGGETLVADGASGTLLMESGLPAGQCPESVNLEKPELLEEIASRYHHAGADIVHTNTFGGSSLKLAQYDLEDRVEEINRIAVEKARKAVGEHGYVSGSCGPTGRILKPYGDVDPEEVLRAFVDQIGVLIGSGVDMITIETMTDLREATLAVRAARTVSVEIPIVATMTFDSTPRGFYTIMGVGVAEAVTGLVEVGANVIGSNCGSGIDQLTEIAVAFRECTDLPLCFQPNAGLPVSVAGEVIYPETPGLMAEKARRLLTVGISIIGGCCGTTPDHVRALRRIVDSTYPCASEG